MRLLYQIAKIRKKYYCYKIFLQKTSQRHFLPLFRLSRISFYFCLNKISIASFETADYM